MILLSYKEYFKNLNLIPPVALQNSVGSFMACVSNCQITEGKLLNIFCKIVIHIICLFVLNQLLKVQLAVLDSAREPFKMM